MNHTTFFIQEHTKTLQSVFKIFDNSQKHTYSSKGITNKSNNERRNNIGPLVNTNCDELLRNLSLSNPQVPNLNQQFQVLPLRSQIDRSNCAEIVLRQQLENNPCGPIYNTMNPNMNKPNDEKKPCCSDDSGSKNENTSPRPTWFRGNPSYGPFQRIQMGLQQKMNSCTEFLQNKGNIPQPQLNSTNPFGNNSGFEFIKNGNYYWGQNQNDISVGANPFLEHNDYDDLFSQNLFNKPGPEAIKSNNPELTISYADIVTEREASLKEKEKNNANVGVVIPTNKESHSYPINHSYTQTDDLGNFLPYPSPDVLHKSQVKEAEYGAGHSRSNSPHKVEPINQMTKTAPMLVLSKPSGPSETIQKPIPGQVDQNTQPNESNGFIGRQTQSGPSEKILSPSHEQEDENTRPNRTKEFVGSRRQGEPSKINLNPFQDEEDKNTRPNQTKEFVGSRRQGEPTKKNLNPFQDEEDKNTRPNQTKEFTGRMPQIEPETIRKPFQDQEDQNTRPSQINEFIRPGQQDQGGPFEKILNQFPEQEYRNTRPPENNEFIGPGQERKLSKKLDKPIQDQQDQNTRPNVTKGFIGQQTQSVPPEKIFSPSQDQEDQNTRPNQTKIFIGPGQQRGPSEKILNPLQDKEDKITRPNQTKEFMGRGQPIYSEKEIIRGQSFQDIPFGLNDTAGNLVQGDQTQPAKKLSKSVPSSNTALRKTNNKIKPVGIISPSNEKQNQGTHTFADTNASPSNSLPKTNLKRKTSKTNRPHTAMINLFPSKPGIAEFEDIKPVNRKVSQAIETSEPTLQPISGNVPEKKRPRSNKNVIDDQQVKPNENLFDAGQSQQPLYNELNKPTPSIVAGKKKIKSPKSTSKNDLSGKQIPVFDDGLSNFVLQNDLFEPQTISEISPNASQTHNKSSDGNESTSLDKSPGQNRVVSKNKPSSLPSSPTRSKLQFSPMDSSTHFSSADNVNTKATKPVSAKVKLNSEKIKGKKIGQDIEFTAESIFNNQKDSIDPPLHQQLLKIPPPGQNETQTIGKFRNKNATNEGRTQDTRQPENLTNYQIPGNVTKNLNIPTTTVQESNIPVQETLELSTRTRDLTESKPLPSSKFLTEKKIKSQGIEHGNPQKGLANSQKENSKPNGEIEGALIFDPGTKDHAYSEIRKMEKISKDLQVNGESKNNDSKSDFPATKQLRAQVGPDSDIFGSRIVTRAEIPVVQKNVLRINPTNSEPLDQLNTETTRNNEIRNNEGDLLPKANPKTKSNQSPSNTKRKKSLPKQISNKANEEVHPNSNGAFDEPSTAWTVNESTKPKKKSISLKVDSVNVTGEVNIPITEGKDGSQPDFRRKTSLKNKSAEFNSDSYNEKLHPMGRENGPVDEHKARQPDEKLRNVKAGEPASTAHGHLPGNGSRSEFAGTLPLNTLPGKIEGHTSNSEPGTTGEDEDSETSELTNSSNDLPINGEISGNENSKPDFHEAKQLRAQVGPGSDIFGSRIVTRAQMTVLQKPVLKINPTISEPLDQLKLKTTANNQIGNQKSQKPERELLPEVNAATKFIQTPTNVKRKKSLRKVVPKTDNGEVHPNSTGTFDEPSTGLKVNELSPTKPKKKSFSVKAKPVNANGEGKQSSQPNLKQKPSPKNKLVEFIQDKYQEKVLPAGKENDDGFENKMNHPDKKLRNIKTDSTDNVQHLQKNGSNSEPTRTPHERTVPSDYPNLSVLSTPPSQNPENHITPRNKTIRNKSAKFNENTVDVDKKTNQPDKKLRNVKTGETDSTTNGQHLPGIGSTSEQAGTPPGKIFSFDHLNLSAPGSQNPENQTTPRNKKFQKESSKTNENGVDSDHNTNQPDKKLRNVKTGEPGSTANDQHLSGSGSSSELDGTQPERIVPSDYPNLDVLQTPGSPRPETQATPRNKAFRKEYLKTNENGVDTEYKANRSDNKLRNVKIGEQASSANRQHLSGNASSSEPSGILPLKTAHRRIVPSDYSNLRVLQTPGSQNLENQTTPSNKTFRNGCFKTNKIDNQIYLNRGGSAVQKRRNSVNSDIQPNQKMRTPLKNSVMKNRTPYLNSVERENPNPGSSQKRRKPSKETSCGEQDPTRNIISNQKGSNSSSEGGFAKPWSMNHSRGISPSEGFTNPKPYFKNSRGDNTSATREDKRQNTGANTTRVVQVIPIQKQSWQVSNPSKAHGTRTLGPTNNAQNGQVGKRISGNTQPRRCKINFEEAPSIKRGRSVSFNQYGPGREANDLLSTKDAKKNVNARKARSVSTTPKHTSRSESPTSPYNKDIIFSVGRPLTTYRRLLKGEVEMRIGYPSRALKPNTIFPEKENRRDSYYTHFVSRRLVKDKETDLTGTVARKSQSTPTQPNRSCANSYEKNRFPNLNYPNQRNFSTSLYPNKFVPRMVYNDDSDSSRGTFNSYRQPKMNNRSCTPSTPSQRRDECTRHFNRLAITPTNDTKDCRLPETNSEQWYGTKFKDPDRYLRDMENNIQRSPQTDYNGYSQQTEFNRYGQKYFITEREPERNILGSISAQQSKSNLKKTSNNLFCDSTTKKKGRSVQFCTEMPHYSEDYGKSIENFASFKKPVGKDRRGSRNFKCVSPELLDENIPSGGKNQTPYKPDFTVSIPCRVPESFYLLKSEFDSYLERFASAIRASHEAELAKLEYRSRVTNARSYKSDTTVEQRSNLPAGKHAVCEPISNELDDNCTRQQNAQSTERPCSSASSSNGNTSCESRPCSTDCSRSFDPCNPYRVYSVDQLTKPNTYDGSGIGRYESPRNYFDSKQKEVDTVDMDQLERTGIFAIARPRPTTRNRFVFTPSPQSSTSIIPNDLEDVDNDEFDNQTSINSYGLSNVSLKEILTQLDPLYTASIAQQDLNDNEFALNPNQISQEHEHDTDEFTDYEYNGERVEGLKYWSELEYEADNEDILNEPAIVNVDYRNGAQETVIQDGETNEYSEVEIDNYPFHAQEQIQEYENNDYEMDIDNEMNSLLDECVEIVNRENNPLFSDSHNFQECQNPCNISNNDNIQQVQMWVKTNSVSNDPTTLFDLHVNKLDLNTILSTTAPTMVNIDPNITTIEPCPVQSCEYNENNPRVIVTFNEELPILVSALRKPGNTTDDESDSSTGLSRSRSRDKNVRFAPTLQTQVFIQDDSSPENLETSSESEFNTLESPSDLEKFANDNHDPTAPQANRTLSITSFYVNGSNNSEYYTSMFRNPHNYTYEEIGPIVPNISDGAAVSRLISSDTTFDSEINVGIGTTTDVNHGKNLSLDSVLDKLKNEKVIEENLEKLMQGFPNTSPNSHTTTNDESGSNPTTDDVNYLNPQ